MKRLLLPLIAALAIPTAANAESYYLILNYAATTGYELETIPMESLDQCEKAGTKLLSSKRLRRTEYFAYECIFGK